MATLVGDLGWVVCSEHSHASTKSWASSRRLGSRKPRSIAIALIREECSCTCRPMNTILLVWIFWSLPRRSKPNRAATMTPVRWGIRDDFAQHAGDQVATDSTKDSRQKKLTEKKRGGVESQILTQDIPLVILKGEAQRIRATCSKKRQNCHLTFPAVETRR